MRSERRRRREAEEEVEVGDEYGVRMAGERRRERGREGVRREEEGREGDE